MSAISNANSAQAFQNDGYVVIRPLVTEPLLGFLWRHLKAVAPRIGEGSHHRLVEQSLTADVVMEHLLQRLLPELEQAAGLKLYPTYSCCRLYEHGNILLRHSDRKACEISATVNLGQDPADPWPIWIEGRNGEAEVRLHPGDALVYRGIECDHWRLPYQGSLLGQVFLHYVDQDGPHAEWRFDKRDGLNLNPPLPI
jgi:hypothetical protein